MTVMGQGQRVCCAPLAEENQRLAEALETEREQHAADAARARLELARVGSAAAHELRSPLQAISGFADLLDRFHSGHLNEQGTEFLGWIQASATRLEILIEDLVTYCRIDPPADLATVDLAQLVTETWATLGPQIAARRAEMTAGCLPTVLGDRAQLGLVLHHLVGNALKFTAEDVVPVVHVDATREAEAWIVSVIDNGLGVNPAHHERIFGLFQRLHPVERFPGTGLGLALCRRIVEGHGGKLWVEAVPGGGSRFSFMLPDPPAGPAPG